MSLDRRRCRILAMQALCHWEVQEDDSTDSLRTMLRAQDASGTEIRAALKLVGSARKNREKIDQCISDASEHWDLQRVSPVERNIMRVAVAEWLETEVPPKVALNEAIEIARTYGGEQSPRYVNGVLHAVLKQLENNQEESE